MVDDGGKDPTRRAKELVCEMIAVHEIDPALGHVLLDEIPYGGKSKAIHDEFETKYLGRYKAVIVASSKHRGPTSIEIAAQVLSAAVRGVIHEATRRGTLGSPMLRQKTRGLVSGFLLKDLREQAADGLLWPARSAGNEASRP
jgi:hypothetical protein